MLSVVNKPLKDYLRHSFQVFRAGLKTTEERKEPEDIEVDTRVSIMKAARSQSIDQRLAAMSSKGEQPRSTAQKTSTKIALVRWTKL